MKKIKSILAMTLALILCFSTVAFAADTTDSETGIPEYATKHTVELTLAPESDENDNSIAPYVWGDPSVSLIDHHTVNTAEFYLSDQYFAYEMEAIPASGTATSQGYAVSLMCGSATKAAMTGNADGGLYKKDWITISTDANYYFKITNNTDYVLNVYITYYSWN